MGLVSSGGPQTPPFGGGEPNDLQKQQVKMDEVTFPLFSKLPLTFPFFSKLPLTFPFFSKLHVPSLFFKVGLPFFQKLPLIFFLLFFSKAFIFLGGVWQGKELDSISGTAGC